MASLVADYGSDEDESENDDTCDEKHDDLAMQSKSKNFLMQESDDSDDSEESGDENPSSEKQQISEEDKLPAPAIGGISQTEGVTSVFSNPFEKAEMAKNSVLEQHVRMTEKLPERGIKKVCYKFKKGKCRMGKNCRYFHDQESVIGKAQESVGEDSSNVFNIGQWGQGHRGQGAPVINEPVDDDNFMAGKKRKSRVGVTNTLLPPKKAMSGLVRQRESERPWTVNQF